MVELMVGLVAVLALLAGLLQVAGLTRAHTDTMVEARREAGFRAMLDPGRAANVGTTPDYIRDWRAGPDERRHTRDDRHTAGDPSAFQRVIAARAAPDPAGWQILDGIEGNRVSALYHSAVPAGVFGLVEGYDTQSVPVLPAVRALLYRADTVQVESRVWMTRTGGIY